jgi:predicted membrane protein
MDFISVIKILGVLLLAISICYIVMYFDWKYSISYFTEKGNQLKIFGKTIDEEDMTLRKMFFYKRQRWSKASRYPSDPVYRNTTLIFFCFIPTISWKEIDYEY